MAGPEVMEEGDPYAANSLWRPGALSGVATLKPHLAEKL